jgi:hypothetical protein
MKFRTNKSILDQTFQKDKTTYAFIFCLLNLILLQDFFEAIDSESLIRGIGCAVLVPIWIYLGLKEIKDPEQKTL